MSNIHVNRNRESLGQYTPKEVAEGLATGELLPTDLAWQDPMESWRPLSEFKDLPEVDVTRLAAPMSPPLMPEFVPTPSSVDEPAWERRKELGFFKALGESIHQIFAAPGETFSRMKQEGGLGGPLLFYVLLATFSILVATSYSAAVFLVNPEGFITAQSEQIAESVQKLSAQKETADFAKMYGDFLNGFMNKQSILLYYGLNVLLAPFIAVIMSFLASGIYHGCLFLLGGAKRPFETTFRVICYASGATSLLQIFPLCGPFLAAIGTFVVIVIGLKQAHGTDYTRAIFTMLLVILCCCGSFGLALLTGLATGAR